MIVISNLSTIYSQNSIKTVPKEYPFKWAYAHGTSKTLEKGKLSDKNNAQHISYFLVFKGDDIIYQVEFILKKVKSVLQPMQPCNLYFSHFNANTFSSLSPEVKSTTRDCKIWLCCTKVYKTVEQDFVSVIYCKMISFVHYE